MNETQYTIKTDSDALRRAITNAALFTASKDTLGVFRRVLVEVHADRLIVVGTDRYTMYVEAVDGSNVSLRAHMTPHATFSLSREDVKLWAQLLKVLGGAVHVEVKDVDGLFIDGRRFADNSAEGQIPKWSQLFTGAAQREADGESVERLAFNPDYLARFSKLKLSKDSREKYVLSLTGTGKKHPTIVQFATATATAPIGHAVGLIMPVKADALDAMTLRSWIA